MQFGFRICIVVLVLMIATQTPASEPTDAHALLSRFRAINWDTREVGRDKDLSDEAWEVRIEVENGLIALGKPAVPALIEACDDSNRHVRLLAAYVLGFLNDKTAAKALMQVVFRDPYAPARLMAVEGLGRLGAQEALSIVKAATEDRSPHVREAAQWAFPRVEKGEGVGDALWQIAISTFDKNQIATAVVGKPGPEFALTDDSGETVRLSDFRQKKNIVIVFLLADW